MAIGSDSDSEVNWLNEVIAKEIKDDRIVIGVNKRNILFLILTSCLRSVRILNSSYVISKLNAIASSIATTS